jgi:hypothetical protein
MWKFSDGTTVSERLDIEGDSRLAEFLRWELKPGMERIVTAPPGSKIMLVGYKPGAVVRESDTDDVTIFLRSVARSHGASLETEPTKPKADKGETRRVPARAII